MYGVKHIIDTQKHLLTEWLSLAYFQSLGSAKVPVFFLWNEQCFHCWTGHFLAWRSAFRHARVIMSSSICNFLLQTKHGNVKMFSYFPPGSPSLSQKNLSVFKPLSTDTLMYKWNGFMGDSGSMDGLLECVCGESLVVPNSSCLSFSDTQGETLRFASYD